MNANRPELWQKLNSLLNHYGNDENFVNHLHEWPRTIKIIIYNSEKLMLRFGLVELLPDHEEIFTGME